MTKNRKKLVRTRQSYTNEQYCHALEGIRAVEPSDTLIPQASYEQAQFEAELLGQIGYGIDPQSGDSGPQHPFGILELSPKREKSELLLANADDVVKDFVSKIAPMVRQNVDSLTGVPGLRVEFTKKGATLRLLHAPGCIILRGMTSDIWHSALCATFDEPDADYQGESVKLHDVEKLHIDNYPLASKSKSDRIGTEILSGMFRRVHAFRARTCMRFTDLWFNFLMDEVVINVEWAGDLSHFEVIARLGKPLFGLPLKVANGEDCFCDPCTIKTYSVKMQDSSLGGVTLNLRRNGMYERHLPPRPSGPCQFASTGGVMIDAGQKRRLPSDR